MRQAGRYLPSYQALRKRYSLKTLFTTKELIEEVTLLPIDALDPDAAILFSDITIIALSLGLDLDFVEGVGPVIHPKICTEKDLDSLAYPYLEMPFLEEAIASLKKRLKAPLIGFCAAPFTAACYFAEKKLLYKDPAVFSRLLRKITDCTKWYLQMQIDQGVDAVQIFDSSAYLLPKEQFKTYSLPYISELLRYVDTRNIPSIVFARGSCVYKQELIDLHPRAISFDWHEPLSDLRRFVPSSMAVQGNFDPDLLYAKEELIAEQIHKHLPQKPGIIVNLGHGLKPDMDPGKVKAFVDIIKSYG